MSLRAVSCLCLLAGPVQSALVPSSNPMYPGARSRTPKASSAAAPVAPVGSVPDLKRQLREVRSATQTIATTCRHALIGAVTQPPPKANKAPPAAAQKPTIVHARLEVRNGITQLPPNAIIKVHAAEAEAIEATEATEVTQATEAPSIRLHSTRAKNNYSPLQEENLGIWLKQYQRTRELTRRGPPAAPAATAPTAASTRTSLTSLQQGAASRAQPKAAPTNPSLTTLQQVARSPPSAVKTTSLPRTTPTPTPPPMTPSTTMESRGYHQPLRSQPPVQPKPQTAAEVARARTAAWEAQWAEEKKKKEMMDASGWYDPFNRKEERMPAFVKARSDGAGRQGPGHR